MDYLVKSSDVKQAWDKFFEYTGIQLLPDPNQSDILWGAIFSDMLLDASLGKDIDPNPFYDIIDVEPEVREEDSGCQQQSDTGISLANEKSGRS